MQKILFIFFTLLIVGKHASAQLERIVFFGKKEIGAFYAESVTIDKEGNTYVAGRFNKDFSINFKSYQKDFAPINESLDYYIIKLDKDFSILWCKQYGGIGQEKTPCLAADHDGNLYFAGNYYKGWTIATQNGQVTLPTEKYELIYLAKLDKNGDYIWVKNIESPIGGTPHSLVITPKNEALLCGLLFTTKTDKSKLPIEIPAGGKNNGYLSFLLAYAADGSCTFKKYIHNPNWVGYTGAVVDEKNNYYFFDQFEDTISAIVNNSNYNAESNIRRSQTSTIRKIDPQGKIIWKTEIGKQKNNERRDIKITSIAVDEMENIYFCAYFLDSVQAGNAKEKTIISKGKYDILFGKLNSKGVLLWQKGFGSEKMDLCTTIRYIPQMKRIMIGGHYDAVIPAETLPNLKELPRPLSSRNMFLLETDTDGNVTGSTSIPSKYNDVCKSFLLNPQCGLIMIGSLRDEHAVGIIRFIPQ